jgi:biotin operon repressor
MSRLKRTLQIQQVEHVTNLLESGPFYTAELATKLGITPRSTNRLLADLRAIGVPIVSIREGFRVLHRLGDRKPLETSPRIPQDGRIHDVHELLELGTITSADISGEVAHPEPAPTIPRIEWPLPFEAPDDDSDPWDV